MVVLDDWLHDLYNEDVFVLVICQLMFYLLNMMELLFMTMNSYFFRGKISTVIKKRCLNHCTRHFSAVTTAQNILSELLPKSKLVLKKQKSFYVEKKFSTQTSDSKSLILMDFDVWLYPKFSRSIASLYNYYFVLKGMDNSFSFKEFTRNSVTALQVVTFLLSEQKFPELEGLLTKECKEEVEKNLHFWPKHEVSVLAVDPDKVFKIFPCDIVVISDENDKVFVEIRVIHYVWLKYSSRFKKSDFFHTPIGKKIFDDIVTQTKFGNIYMYCIFNSKFIKEFTKGVASQWTINAINLQCFSDLITA